MTTTKCISSDYGSLQQEVTIYKWSITNFAECCKTVGEFVESPVFYFNSQNNNTKWKIELYPYGEQQENSDYISLHLRSLNDFDTEIYCVFYLNSTNNVVVTINRRYKPYETFGSFQFKKRNDIINSSTSFNLIYKIQSVHTYTDCFSYNQIGNTHIELSKNMEDLLENENFYDVTITVGVKKFHAHKAILAARSSVFAAMFKHDMLEKETNSVKIEDVKPEIFEKILTFIYTGEIENFENIAKDLLVTADKYALEELKKLCAHKICQSINVENVIDLLLFADVHNVSVLKRNTIIFITSHAIELMKIPGFNELQNAPSPILIELFCKLASCVKDKTSFFG